MWSHWQFLLTLRQRQGRPSFPPWKKCHSLSPYIPVNHGTPSELKDDHRTRLDQMKYFWWCYNLKKPKDEKRMELFQPMVALLKVYQLPYWNSRSCPYLFLPYLLFQFFLNNATESHDTVDGALNWASPALGSRSVTTISNCEQISSILLI